MAKRLVGQIKRRLPYDPYPDKDDSDDYFTAVLFDALKQEGIDVYRLKSREWKRYRLFYLVDEDNGLIYILEIVLRDDKTYRLSEKHVDTIKELYIKYYVNRVRKEI